MKEAEIIETSSFSIWIDEEGILRMRIKEEGARVNEEEVKEVFAVIKKLTAGKKVLELMEGGTFHSFNEGAQKYASMHGRDFFIASALVSKSKIMRLLVNFFLLCYPQPVPYKVFATEAVALKWLRKFKSEEIS